MEPNTDRPGMDYRAFELAHADPKLCLRACAADAPRCRAWTYVRPNTTQGPKPRCWLKFGVPRPQRATCCVSGTSPAALDEASGPRMSGMQWNTDLPGNDYAFIDLPSDNPELCQDECRRDSSCKAWTYVRPNTTKGPRPICCLKKAVPPVQRNSCCVSGTKGG